MSKASHEPLGAYSALTVDLIMGLSLLSTRERLREKMNQTQTGSLANVFVFSATMKIPLFNAYRIWMIQSDFYHLDSSCEDSSWWSDGCWGESSNLPPVLPDPVDPVKHFLSNDQRWCFWTFSLMQRQTATVCPPCRTVKTVKKVMAKKEWGKKYNN